MTEPLQYHTAATVVEHRSIGHIPHSERYGTARGLLFLWLSMNSTVLTMTTGAIGIALGASLTSTIFAIVIGNLIGALFMAYHSAQGPKLGLPQMIQSRAQFGFLGAAVPNAMAILMYIGYFVSADVLGGQAVASLAHVSVGAGIAIATVVTWLVAWLGYRAIHLLNRVMAVVSSVVLAVLVVPILGHLPTAHYTGTHNTVATFMLMLSIAASWQITFAPYVSDYSRYLPASTSSTKTFIYTYIGSTVGATLFMIVGAIAGVEALTSLNDNAVGYLSGLVPGMGTLFTVLLFFGIVAVNCENLYGPYVTGLATVTRAGGRIPSEISRLIFTGALAIFGGLLGSMMSSHFILTLLNFITFLLYLLVPWTAINLVDFYVINKGSYDIGAIFEPNGKYGLINWLSIAIYAVAIAAEIPFMNSAIYEGPVAKLLGGSDISWIVGLVVAAGTYLLAERTKQNRAVVATTLDASGQAA